MSLWAWEMSGSAPVAGYRSGTNKQSGIRGRGDFSRWRSCAVVCTSGRVGAQGGGRARGRAVGCVAGHAAGRAEVEGQAVFVCSYVCSYVRAGVWGDPFSRRHVKTLSLSSHMAI